MSLYDYEAYRQLPHVPFASLIMVAYQRADTGNAAALERAFPQIVAEIRARYNAPGGILPTDPEAHRWDAAADEQAAVHAEAEAEPGYDLVDEF